MTYNRLLGPDTGQLADMPTRGLVKSQTRQLAGTGRLVDDISIIFAIKNDNMFYWIYIIIRQCHQLHVHKTKQQNILANV